MTKPRISTDQHELDVAVVLSIENSNANGSQHCRTPLEVAREEWRKKTYTPLHAGMRPEVKANWPTARLLETPAPVPLADTVDMDAFNEAKADWPKWNQSAHVHHGQNQAPD